MFINALWFLPRLILTSALPVVVQNFVENFSEFSAAQRNAGKHVTIMSELSRLVDARTLMQVHLQQASLSIFWYQLVLPRHCNSDTAEQPHLVLLTSALWSCASVPTGKQSLAQWLETYISSHRQAKSGARGGLYTSSYK